MPIQINSSEPHEQKQQENLQVQQQGTNSVEKSSQPVEAAETLQDATTDESNVTPSVTNTDPNAITVTISDKETPIVILYGPPACGKTMTLIRLARYLRDKGYMVEPDKSFRDSQDPGYKKLCDDFDSFLSSSRAADSTSRISFLLAVVRNSTGSPICQILEAPGEHYYNPGTTTTDYPPYVNAIINSRNRRLWAVMLEPNWETTEIRRMYVDNIKFLKKKFKPRDKIVFIYNKVDQTSVTKQSDTIKEVENHFPGIFEPFRNANPVTRFWKKYECDLVPFQTGDYSKMVKGGKTWVPSDDEYPKKLWETIIKMIRG